MTTNGLRAKQGGAALEYILVSTFAAALSVAAFLVVIRMVKDELGRMSERLGVTLDTSPLDGLGDGP